MIEALRVPSHIYTHFLKHHIFPKRWPKCVRRLTKARKPSRCKENCVDIVIMESESGVLGFGPIRENPMSTNAIIIVNQPKLWKWKMWICIWLGRPERPAIKRWNESTQQITTISFQSTLECFFFRNKISRKWNANCWTARATVLYINGFNLMTF